MWSSGRGKCEGGGATVYGKLDVMNPPIRRYRSTDEEPVVALSLRAWAPVFRSLEKALEVEIFRRLHPDWQVARSGLSLAIDHMPARSATAARRRISLDSDVTR